MSFLSFNTRNIHETYVIRFIFSVVIARTMISIAIKNQSGLLIKV